MRTANLFKFAVLLLLLFASSEHVHTATLQYWKSVLPNETMPRTLVLDTRPGVPGNGIAWTRQSANTNYQSNYDRVSAEDHPANPPASPFFLENELYTGNKMMMAIERSEKSGSVFLPRTVSDSLPLSADKLPLILKKYSIQDDSEEASQIKMTIDTCSLRPIKGEERTCLTSLESMIDFAISSLGKKIHAYSTEAERETQVQDFKFKEGIKRLGDEAVVACHKQAFPYAVFLCHTLKPTKAYLVPLTGTTEVTTNATAIAVCHQNTTDWNPGHLAFRVLGVKPGTVPICHFLPEVDVVWTSRK